MKDIKNFALDELKKEFAGMREPAYRAEQIFSWLYRKGVNDFSKMSNLPQPLRDKLRNRYFAGRLELVERHRSVDGTERFLFRLIDGNFTETVLIRARQRATICLSTQVGCKFACSFCASGIRGLVRNLTLSEIIGQISFVRFDLKNKISNYVFMGMGEPLDNYENLFKAIMIMNDPKGMDIGARRITVSTCGLIPGIEKLKKLGVEVNLCVSLHATDNRLRSEITPVNRRYPLEKLIESCEKYICGTGRMITLEYILIKDKNDAPENADQLARIAKKLRAKVNLIPYSAIPNLSFKTPTRQNIDIFMNRLMRKGAKVTLRKSKGGDIQAACGQLAGKIASGRAQ